MRLNVSGVATEQALAAAMNAFGGEMFGLANRALDDRGLAEDAVQETFLRAWRSAHRFNAEVASLRAWLFAILRNVVIDSARARNTRPAVAELADVEIEDRVDASLRAWIVEEALRRLTPEHRDAVVQIHYFGRAAVDVAAVTGVPVATVRTRLFYGLRALRQTLDELGWNDD